MSEIKAGLKDVVVAKSEVCSIDGDKGELIYAGINIHELAEHATFEEVVYLLLHRRLPNQAQLAELDKALKSQRAIPDGVLQLLRMLPKTTEPMDALRTAVSALSSYDPNPEDNSLEASQARVLRLVAQMPTIVAAFQRIRSGQDLIAPKAALGQAANFLYMLSGKEPDPTSARVFDIALILHADHGFNASTFAARVTASTLSDVYSAITSAIGTLKGPLHGGANQRVMEMLLEIGDKDPLAYVKDLLGRHEKIMGFGHRVYRTEDPRATHLRKMSQQLSLATGNLKWYEMSKKIEDFMIAEKKINANVDFYSASVYYTLGIPTDLFTLLFAMSRISGWGAHVLEQYADNRLIRPREDYVGPKDQHWVPIAQRP
ncbi:MAG: citrate synthase [Deltaproteobacteria bacterium]|nr:citrate synthase [Deltaproteobacteria bacterium]